MDDEYYRRQLEAAEAIEWAMLGIRIVVCERCRGFGVIGLPTLQTACPDCDGCGETTTSELELEDTR